MSWFASFIFLILFSFLTSFTVSAQDPGSKDPTYIYHVCPNTTIYLRNSTYFTNLRTLLSIFSFPNASYSTGFQNVTVGQATNRVTGLFNCRGDVSPEVCRRCVRFAVNDTLTRCPNQSEVTLSYDECVLRYSNRNIISTLNTDGGHILFNTQNVTSNQTGFRNLVLSIMNEAAIEASNTSRRFDARKTDFPAFQTLYVLVQCTPDLTTQLCLSCLRQIIYQLPTDKVGGRYDVPSCRSQYELYPFYNESNVRTLSPSPPSPPVSTPPLSAPPRPGKDRNTTVLVIAIVVPIIVAVLLFMAGYCLLAKRAKRTYGTASTYDGDDITTADSLQLDYRTIQTATNDFAKSNKIGQGGFGEVFKGTLLNGTEVAVKRLSKSSGQGEAEFKNEVVLVAKLQHRNLVRLLGFCLAGEERVLVYEYVPNKSLDYFLFDPAKQDQLDWTRRFKIFRGIARGILYLHQDSRLTIIHRDLKASNVLLDADMNPKIADFGMARIFVLDQTEENTSRIVGTYGYMSPEYAIRGHYSMKSDVYSYGVLVLEIISGKKNSSFYQTDGAHDLVSYAWELWSNGTPLEFVDPAIVENCQRSEVVRCVHIGLLCVQEDPVDRPTMSTIVLMLSSNTLTLPVPRPPGFFFQSRPPKDPLDSDQCTTSKSLIGSVDDASITDVYPR